MGTLTTQNGPSGKRVGLLGARSRRAVRCCHCSREARSAGPRVHCASSCSLHLPGASNGPNRVSAAALARLMATPMLVSITPWRCTTSEPGHAARPQYLSKTRVPAAVELSRVAMKRGEAEFVHEAHVLVVAAGAHPRGRLRVAPAQQAPPSASSATERYVDLTHDLSSESIFWPTGETFQPRQGGRRRHRRGLLLRLEQLLRQRARRHASRRAGALRAGTLDGRSRFRSID